MARKLFAAGTTALSSDAIYPIAVLVTAAAADAKLQLQGDGVDEIVIAAKAGETAEWIHPGPNRAGEVKGPVQVILTGAGAFGRVDY